MLPHQSKGVSEGLVTRSPRKGDRISSRRAAKQVWAWNKWWNIVILPCFYHEQWWFHGTNQIRGISWEIIVISWEYSDFSNILKLWSHSTQVSTWISHCFTDLCTHKSYRVCDSSRRLYLKAIPSCLRTHTFVECLSIPCYPMFCHHHPIAFLSLSLYVHYYIHILYTSFRSNLYCTGVS